MRDTAAKGLERGYRPGAEMTALIRAHQAPRLLASLGSAAGDHALIAASAAAGVWAIRAGLGLAVVLPLHLLLYLLIGRSMRGLECLVHEASHYNWLRRDHRMNDRLADWTCAWAVLSRVEDYRRTHQIHHARFGCDQDPDRIRFAELGLSRLDRSRLLPFVGGILSRLVVYIPGWWRAIGVDRRTVLLFLAWHGCVVVAPLALLVSPGAALLIWGAYWFAPLMVVLPVLRFIGEAGEHDFERPESIIGNTFSNIGWLHRLLFHPHNDGYHSLHHLHPSVPHFRLARAHRALAAADPRYGGLFLYRDRVLQEPRGLDSAAPRPAP